MHWTRRVGVLYLLIVGWAGFASAQDIVNDNSGVVFLDDISGSMSLSNDGGTYLLFHRMIGDGVGIRDSYSRLGIRGKIIDDGLSHIFGEAHALLTDGPRFGYNVGLGYRRFVGAGLLGGHVWYDDYGSEANNRYQQIVFGAEYLHPDFDVRTNVYLPISEDEHFLRVTNPGTVTGFAGNNLVTFGQGLYERAYNAYEGEVGVPVPVIEWLRGYVGGYALQRSDDAIYGVRARVEGRVARDITLNAMVTNDNQFGTNLNLGVEVRLSNQGLPTRFGGQNYSAIARRYDQVQRSWNTHIVQDVDDVNVPITQGGRALTAFFVDDSAAPGGDGTFESPANMLPGSADADFVLVRTGNQMTTGVIALNEGQQLLGEGKAHIIQTDTMGLIPLPADFAQTGPFPTLLGDGTPAPVVTLNDNTRVAGFDFATTNAISGTDIVNYELECLTGTVFNGVNVAAAGGTGLVNDVNFSVIPGGTGVEVSNTSGLLDLQLSNITTLGGGRGVVIDANKGDIAYTADNITTSGAGGAGVVLMADTADLSGTINTLTSSGNIGHGVELIFDEATGTTTINDPQINGNGIDGIHAVADNGTVYNLDVIGTDVASASISGNMDDNVDADSINTSTFNVFIDPITMGSAGDNGFEFLSSGDATLNATLQDVLLTGNMGNGIEGLTTDSATTNLLVTGTTATGSGEDGANLATSNQGVLNATFMDSTFVGNTQSGVQITSSTLSQAAGTFTNFTGTGNGEEGLKFASQSGGMVTIAATTSDFSGNGTSGALSGVLGTSTGPNSVTMATFDDVNADGNSLHGFEFNAMNLGSVWANIESTTGTSTASGNQGAGVQFTGTNADEALLTMSGANEFLGNGLGGPSSGVNYDVNGANVGIADFSGVSTGNTLDAVTISMTNVSNGAVDLQDATVSGNGEDGADINLVDTTLTDIMFMGETFSAFNVNNVIASTNGQDGVNVFADNTDLVGGTIDNLTATSQMNGLVIDLTNGSDWDLSVTNSTLSNNTMTGVHLLADDNDTMSVIDINSNDIIANGDTNVLADLTGTANVELHVDSNNILGLGTTLNNGVEINVSDSAALINSSVDGNIITGMGNTAVAATFSGMSNSGSLTIDGNDISSNGGSGVDVSILDTAVVDSLSVSTNLNVTNNLGGPGIQVLGTANGQLNNLFIDNNMNITNNGGAGINVDVTDFTLGNVSIDGNFPISGNMGDGIHFSAVNSALTDLSIVNHIDISGNMDDGIDVLLDTVTGTPNVTVDNNTVTGNLDQGIIVSTVDTALADVSTSLNVISGNPTGPGLSVSIDNASGMMDLANLTVDGNMVTGAAAEGINLFVNQATAVNTVSLSGNDLQLNANDGLLATFQSSTLGAVTAAGNLIQDNSGGGFIFMADDTTITDITYNLNTTANNTGDDGVRFGLTNSPVSGTLAVTESFMEGNGGDGLDLDLNGSSISNLVIADNSGDLIPATDLGFEVDISGSHWYNRNLSPTETITEMVYDITSTGQVVAVSITGGSEFELWGEENKGLQTVNGVVVDPLAFTVPGAVMDGDTIISLTYNGYDDTFFLFDHFDIEYAAAGATTATSNEMDLAGATVTATFSGGAMLSGQLDANGYLLVDQATAGVSGGISGNTDLGVRLSAVNGSNIGALTIDNNTIDGNGSHGIEFQIADSTLPGPGSPGVISNNTVSNHAAGDAFRMIDPDTNGNVIGLDFTDNTFSDNSGAGVNVSLNSESGGLTSTMTGMTITNNGSFGIRADAIEDAQLNLTIGDSALNTNTISMNQDAAIAVTMADMTTGSLTVVNTSASSTTNGADANFDGEGIAVRLTDDASLSSLTLGDPLLVNTGFSNNASDGIQISADLNANITDPTIQNVLATGNGGDGVNIVRMDNATIENGVITGSQISGNTGDGIDIIAGIADLTDEYDITNNTIDANGGRGIAMQVQFDSDIVTNITGNTITNNTGGSGIDFTEVVSAMPAFDSRSITATIDNNTISNNGSNVNEGAGVNVLALHDLTISNNTIDGNTGEGINLAAAALNPLDPTMILNNMITNNGTFGLGQHGIDIANPNMSVVIDGNLIAGNGDFFFNNGNGINNVLGVDSVITNNDIIGNADNGIALVNATHTINDNLIMGNQADGIEAVSNSDTNGLTISADMNDIISNGARGLNTLIVGNTLADITFTNGTIQGNALEGVYIYETTSTNRDVDTDPNDPLFEGFGDITTNPQLVFNFHNNDVLTNGTMSGFDGTGLVMLIGTSGASTAANNYEDDGGFVSDGMGFTAANLTGRGGVLASVTGNLIDGNVGADVVIESFDSTVEPFATVGTWDAALYEYSAIIPYQQDPLARLDLQFEGNTGGLADVVRPGYFHGFFPEDEFKSRTTTQATAGPFTDGSRLRNSQRLAFRGTNAFGDFSDPAVNTAGLGGDSDNFLYPGVGGSTFRVTAGSDTAGFTDMGSDAFTDLVFEGTAWDGATTATIFGELPFGYDIIP